MAMSLRELVSEVVLSSPHEYCEAVLGMYVWVCVGGDVGVGVGVGVGGWVCVCACVCACVCVCVCLCVYIHT
jgi:hypothetical protein